MCQSNVYSSCYKYYANDYIMNLLKCMPHNYVTISINSSTKIYCSLGSTLIVLLILFSVLIKHSYNGTFSFCYGSSILGGSGTGSLTSVNGTSSSGSSSDNSLTIGIS